MAIHMAEHTQTDTLYFGILSSPSVALVGSSPLPPSPLIRGFCPPIRGECTRHAIPSVGKVDGYAGAYPPYIGNARVGIIRAMRPVELVW